MRSVTAFCPCGQKLLDSVEAGLVPASIRCPSCGREAEFRPRQKTKSDLTRLIKDEKAEPIAVMRHFLNDEGVRAHLSKREQAGLKKMLDADERAGTYRVTDDDRREEDLKVQLMEAEQAESDRERIPVSVRDAIEAARVLELVR